jgi:formylglycine-generating enzyme
MKQSLSVFILALFGFFSPVLGQVSFSCSYTGQTEVITGLAFENESLEEDTEIKSIVANILSRYNIPTNKITVQPSTQVNNANATTLSGKAYILFSQYFITSIRTKSDAKWRLNGILAHEVAHHILLHTLGNNSSRRDLELEADRWAGSALYKLGANLNQALVCISETALNGSATHPPRAERLNAVKSGWEEAKSNNGGGGDKEETDPSHSANTYIEKATGVSFSMMRVGGGTFQMGADDSDSKAREDEKPVHTVRVSNFYMGRTEVTFDEYDKFCNALARGKPNDGGWGRGKRPVINVSWDDANAYCEWLSATTGKTYRLPTEAEWEFAARGGGNSLYSGSRNIAEVGWYEANSNDQTHPVGQKQANGLGLYDMTGNVFEWCSDLYSDTYYSSSPENNPKGDTESWRTHRVFRGGAYMLSPTEGRVTYRLSSTPTYSDIILGFRVVLIP